MKKYISEKMIKSNELKRSVKNLNDYITLLKKDPTNKKYIFYVDHYKRIIEKISKN